MAELCPKWKGLISLVVFCALSRACSGGFVTIKKAERTIDISSQLIKVNAFITYENKDSKPVSSILFSSDPEWKGDLSYIAAKVSDHKDVG